MWFIYPNWYLHYIYHFGKRRKESFGMQGGVR
jgi:hypothetical protein